MAQAATANGADKALKTAQTKGSADDVRDQIAALQADMAELTRAAIAVQTVRPEAGDAISWLERRLATQPAGTLHLIYHTIAWQYFPAERQQVGTALTQALEARPDILRDTRFAIELGLTLRLWPDNLTVTLARVDFHGRWVKWLAD